jgi:hypothetical protein
MTERGEIWAAEGRAQSAAQPISEAGAAPGRARSARIEVEDWIIEIMEDAVIVKCAGVVTTSMRTGQLGQVIVRRDPPASSSHAREIAK